MTDTHADLPERPVLLLMLAGGPAIWVTHFLVTYATVAVACGPRGPGRGAIASAQMLVLVYTLVALGGIAVVAWHGWRRHRHGEETTPHDMDTPGDRHRFLGFATYLLAALSAVATVFVAVSTTLLPDCR
jgi:hypothetical protein